MSEGAKLLRELNGDMLWLQLKEKRQTEELRRTQRSMERIRTRIFQIHNDNTNNQSANAVADATGVIPAHLPQPTNNT